MAGRSELSLATVRLWGATVGTLAWYPDQQLAGFEYAPTFLQSGIQLSPIHLPLRPGVFQFPELNRATYRGLAGAFADSLPDKFGNALIDQWLAETQRNAADFNPVERLLYVGSRGMGALEYEPAVRKEAEQTLPLNLQELVELCSRILSAKQAQQFQLDPNDSVQRFEGLRKILAVGTSAGGARAKAIIAWNESTGEVRSGQLDADPNFEYWLLKFDGVSENKDKEIADPQGYGRIEYAYHLMAVACGITMTPCRLMEEGGRAHFMTKRFDRTPKGKLHMQSLCALGHHDFNIAGSASYEQAFQLCDALDLGMGACMEAKEQLFLRMSFNVFAYNRDDHTKQIAFLMNKQGQWSLSPAYDLTYAFNPQGQWTSRHQMQVNRKTEGINSKDLLAVGQRQSLNATRCRQAIEHIKNTVRQWPDYAKQAGVDPNFTTQIQHQLEKAAT